MSGDIKYSNVYNTDTTEYCHVILKKTTDAAIQALKAYSDEKLFTEDEWRSLGLQMSPGWEHYMWHCPEKHILLFRRPITYS